MKRLNGRSKMKWTSLWGVVDMYHRCPIKVINKETSSRLMSCYRVKERSCQCIREKEDVSTACSSKTKQIDAKTGRWTIKVRGKTCTYNLGGNGLSTQTPLYGSPLVYTHCTLIHKHAKLPVTSIVLVLFSRLFPLWLPFFPSLSTALVVGVFFISFQ